MFSNEIGPFELFARYGTEPFVLGQFDGVRLDELLHRTATMSFNRKVNRNLRLRILLAQFLLLIVTDKADIHKGFSESLIETAGKVGDEFARD